MSGEKDLHLDLNPIGHHKSDGSERSNQRQTSDGSYGSVEDMYAPHYNRYSKDLASRKKVLGMSKTKIFMKTFTWQLACCCGKNGVIEPDKSKFLQRWDGVCGLGLIFICFAAPLEVAFLDGYVSWPLFVANRMVDLLFIVDMVLQFFIAFPVRSRGHSTLYVMKRKSIAFHYVKTWFVIDFISVIPFDLLGLLANSEEVNKLHVLKVIRLFRLLKLLRLLKGVRIFERWQMEWGISHRKMTLWWLVASVVVASHWMSCALGLVSHLQGVSCVDGSPQGCVETWQSSALEVTGTDSSRRTPPGEGYLLALYTAITIIVHPHAFHPTGPEENLLFIGSLLLGGFVWTRVISRSTAISTSLDRHKIHFKQTMDDVNAIADDLGLSVALRRQLRGFFMNTRDQSKRDTWMELTRQMSPQLRRATAREMNWPWVQQIPYLRGCSWSMITAVAEGLETHRYAQHEIFGKPCHLYVLSRGLVSRCICLTKLLHPGAVWGEDHLLLYCSHLFEDVTSVAQCFSEVLAMNRTRFQDIAKDNPENQELLRKHYVKISVVRGVRYLATQARAKLSAERQSEGLVKKVESVKRTSSSVSRLLSVKTSTSLEEKPEVPSNRISLGSPLSPGPLLRYSTREYSTTGLSDVSSAISVLRSDMEGLEAEFDVELKEMRSSMNLKLSTLLKKVAQIKVGASVQELPSPGEAPNQAPPEEDDNQTLSASKDIENVELQYTAEPDATFQEELGNPKEKVENATPPKENAVMPKPQDLDLPGQLPQDTVVV